MGVQQVTTTAKLLEARKTIGHVYIDPKIKDYIVQVVTATRHPVRVGLGDLTVDCASLRRMAHRIRKEVGHDR